MKTTIAVIADVHYGVGAQDSNRRYDIANTLLARTVRRLNNLIHPDVTVVLGDLIDDGQDPHAKKRLSELKAILDKLDSPYIAIPGNHDCDTDLFYQVFPRPKPIEDVAGIRFLPFIDMEEPGYNASRSQTDLQRTREARADYNGTLVSLQHVCLFPLTATPTLPYNYTNASDIIQIMKETGVNLSISGHHHKGAKNIIDGNITFVNSPGLCEAPFPFLEITIDGDQISTKRHELVMPKELQLVDNHCHTQMAYCNDNMMVEKAIGIAHEFGLAGIKFTEHSGHLHFAPKGYYTCFKDGMDTFTERNNRMSEYLELKKSYESDFAHFGLEIDYDYSGRPILDHADLSHFNHLIGALHSLPGLKKDIPPCQANIDNFLLLTSKILESNISVLAHPFRVFRRSGWSVPPELFEHTAQLLKKHHVAAEINFHTNEPPVDFIKKCLALDVKFSLGSDAHDLHEIGDFAYHLALLKDAGFNGDLSDIII